MANFLVCKFFIFYIYSTCFYIQKEWGRFLKQKPRADSFNSCVILMLSLSKLIRLWQRIIDPKYLSLCHLAANINVKKNYFLCLGHWRILCLDWHIYPGSASSYRCQQVSHCCQFLTLWEDLHSCLIIVNNWIWFVLLWFALVLSLAW